MAKQIPPALLEKTALKIYQRRLKRGVEGDASSDWEQATERLTKQPWRIWWWQFWRIVFLAPAKGILSAARGVWSFFWKTLPTSDWVKLLGLPLTLSIVGTFATNRF